LSRESEASNLRHPVRYGVELAVIGLVYFVLAKAGLALASIHPSASPIWPPTGLALAAVLLRGLPVWPAIFLGALIANATTAGTIATSAAIALGNTLEAVVGGYLVQRWSDGRATFETPTGVARFALIAFACTMISAIVGAGSLGTAGFAQWSEFSSIWLTWWLGDLAGALVITPVLVLWAASVVPSELRQSAAVLATAFAIGMIAFSPIVEQTANRSALGFLAVVPLLWAALMRGQRDTATIALILSGCAVWGTLSEGGPFWRTSLNESFLLLLMFMISTAVPSLVLSADVAARRRTEEDLRRARAQLEQKVHLGTVALESELEQRKRVEAELTREEAALERTREQLAQSQKMEALGQLTGGIAHDFNNLLMIVSGHAQRLQRQLSDPKQRQAVEAIHKAAVRGESLTRQLLAFSRGQKLRPVVVDLREHIESVRGMLRSSLRENIRLSCHVDPDVWPIEVDVAEFDLALVNIAVNARDAMPDGGAVMLAVRNVTLPESKGGGRAGDFVTLSVTDTGAGIAPEILPKVFEPFFTTKAVGKGTGLGLSQVYGFAQQSGGDVTAASEIGRGTTITIHLPRSHGRRAASAERVDAQAAVSGAGTILVVEDNPEVAVVTSALLEHLGYRTVRAEDAADALRALADGSDIRLVFSDIVMPGMNGIALAEELRQRYPRLPVLLTTGFSDMMQAAESRFPVLRKPFELPDLETALRHALQQS
jgi:signal transduction histidine kinase